MSESSCTKWAKCFCAPDGDVDVFGHVLEKQMNQFLSNHIHLLSVCSALMFAIVVVIISTNQPTEQKSVKVDFLGGHGLGGQTFLFDA